VSTEPELKFGVKPAGRERKWILCLSGGGYRGLFTAKVLESLEAHLERPLHEVFDLVAGTSIGSILALGIANGLKAERFVRLFEERGKDIFPDRTLLDRAKSITKARYPSTELREALETELRSARSPRQQDIVGLDRADDDATRTLQAIAAAAWTKFQSDNAAVLAELKRLP
jgi:predicted acylesterase/phospholipase RssA